MEAHPTFLVFRGHSVSVGSRHVFYLIQCKHSVHFPPVMPMTTGLEKMKGLSNKRTPLPCSSCMSASQFPIFSGPVDPHVCWYLLEWWQPCGHPPSSSWKRVLAAQVQGTNWPQRVYRASLQGTQTSRLPAVQCDRWGSLPTGGNPAKRGLAFHLELGCSKVLQQKDPAFKSQKIIVVLSQLFSFLPWAISLYTMEKLVQEKGFFFPPE